RGWLPLSRRPEEGVRISLKRLVERGGATRTEDGRWQAAGDAALRADLDAHLDDDLDGDAVGTGPAAEAEAVDGAGPAEAGPAVAELGLEQLGVAAAGAQQLQVGAPLHDAAALEHEDEVGGLDRRQPVGDDQGGARGQRLAQGVLDGRLVLTVEVAGGLV